MVGIPMLKRKKQEFKKDKGKNLMFKKIRQKVQCLKGKGRNSKV